MKHKQNGDLSTAIEGLLKGINVDRKKIKAKKLRKSLDTIPNDKPGWYKWWAPEKYLKKLLDSKHISKKYCSELLPHLTTKNIDGVKHYCIYVGIATRESIRSRLNWHVNQKHTDSSVESRFLSTLRQSISSIIAHDQYEEDKTTKLINKLTIEYYSVDIPTKSAEAKAKIEAIEKIELTDNMLPLNLTNNKNDIVKSFLKELRRVRKESRNKSK